VRQWEAALSARTVKHVFDVLKSALNWGVRMNAISRNAVDAVEAPRGVETEMRTLQARGIARVLHAASTSSCGFQLQCLSAPVCAEANVSA